MDYWFLCTLWSFYCVIPLLSALKCLTCQGPNNLDKVTNKFCDLMPDYSFLTCDGAISQCYVEVRYGDPKLSNEPSTLKRGCARPDETTPECDAFADGVLVTRSNYGALHTEAALNNRTTNVIRCRCRADCCNAWKFAQMMTCGRGNILPPPPLQMPEAEMTSCPVTYPTEPTTSTEEVVMDERDSAVGLRLSAIVSCVVLISVLRAILALGLSWSDVFPNIFLFNFCIGSPVHRSCGAFHDAYVTDKEVVKSVK